MDRPTVHRTACDGPVFDVFFSYRASDVEDVRRVAEELRNRGLRVWFDQWELRPGQPWQEALEANIERTRSALVFVGASGLGPWERREMRACLHEFVARDMPVIPVLLPGTRRVPKLPIFLRELTWVDLRGGVTPEMIDRIEWGITGRKPRDAA